MHRLLVIRPTKLVGLLVLALPLWMGCDNASELSSLERGKQHFDASRWDEALAAFDDCIGEQPENSDAYRRRGRTYSQLGQFDRAVDDYDTAVRLAPDDPEAYYLRSEAHNQLGHEQLSVADYRKAKQLDPLAKTLYERTSENSSVVLDFTAESTAGENERQDPQQPANPEPLIGALGGALGGGLDSLLSEKDALGGDVEPRDPPLRRSPTDVAGAAGESHEHLVATPDVPLPVANTPDGEKLGSTGSRAFATPTRPPFVADPSGEDSPPPVFETRRATADESDPPVGSTPRDAPRDGRRLPGISTGTIRLAPSAIRPRRDANNNRVTSPFDVRSPAGKKQRPKAPPHHHKNSADVPDLTLHNNPYSPQTARDRKKHGNTGTAPALPKNNGLSPHRALHGTGRLKSYKPHKLDLFGPDSPLSKRPGKPSADALKNPLVPVSPTGIAPPRSGSPGGTAIGPGTIGKDPLRSNPFHQIEPDAFNPYKTSPLTGNPYGAAVPNLPPIGQGGSLAPPTPFGAGGLGAPRRNNTLSGLHGSGSLPGSPWKPSSDLQSLLRPNLGLKSRASGLGLRPGGSSQSPFSAGATSRKRSTTTPRPRIGVPKARGFGGSSGGTIKILSPRR
jgi:hypothetical protein